MRAIASGSLLIACSMLPLAGHAQNRPLLPGTRSGNDRASQPILDMHMHARTAAHYGGTGLPLCAPVDRMPRWDQRRPFGEYDGASALCRTPLLSPATDTALFRQTLASMRRHHVIGVLGGEPGLIAQWMADAPGRFIPGLDLRFNAVTGAARAATPSGAPEIPLPLDSIRALHGRGAFGVLAEVMNQYAGLAPDDARLEPLWQMAEQLEVPVGIHVGGGGPGEAYSGSAAFRARLQSALTLEEVLVRHPRLRVYVMHGGYPMLDDLLALLFSHPQVYVELSMAANVETRPAFYRYLRGIVEAGYADRIMFGSDQMVWPGLIDAAVRAISEAPFLTGMQKRDIFYNNAARFLRLTDDEIARHRALR
ncbi:MAG: amidohydrolase [Cytophagaceae bacterium]|nr:amidohydrolase [Gemmatimonadaceae bacterium]